MNNIESQFMARTIEIAKNNPQAPYGAIIVYDDKEILIESVNSANINPIMHGEISVINNLFSNGFDKERNKLSLYTTAEPCPMCAAAIYWAMIPKVIYGTGIPLLHELFGRQIFIRASDVLCKTPNFYNCNIIGGVMEKECDQLFIDAKAIQTS